MARLHDHKTLAAIATVFTLSSFEEMVPAALILAAFIIHPDIRELFRLWAADPRKALSRRQCMEEGGWRGSSQIEKEKSGDLHVFLDGKKRLITTSSFYSHLITRLILSHPANGPAPKGTATSTRFGVRRDVGKTSSFSGGVSSEI
jgi:hypothetical protein